MKNKAFTLIELLVVVAILSLLLSIVLTSLAGQRQKARIARGLQFSQSLHHALGAYAVGVWRFDEGSRNTAYDASGYGNDGTIYGASYVSDTPSGQGHALGFNGSNSYMGVDLFDDLRNATEFTISFWAKFDTPQGYVFWRDGGWLFQVEPTRYRLRFHLDGAWRGTYYLTHTAIFNEWHHVAITWNGNYTKIYLNGIESVTSTTDNSFNAMSDISRVLDVGRRDSAFYKGLLDEVRIYSQALKTSQTESLYYAGLDNLLEKGLISYQEYQEKLTIK